MATIVREVELLDFLPLDADPNVLTAPVQISLLIVRETELPAFLPLDADANVITVPLQANLTLTRETEVIEMGVIVATWEGDLVSQFVMAAVPTSRTTMYTVPVGYNAIIRWMDLVNTTGSAITVDAWLNGVQWENDRSVPGNDKYARDTITEIGPGQLIELQASGAGVNAFISGVLEQIS